MYSDNVLVACLQLMMLISSRLVAIYISSAENTMGENNSCSVIQKRKYNTFSGPLSLHKPVVWIGIVSVSGKTFHSKDGTIYAM